MPASTSRTRGGPTSSDRAASRDCESSTASCGTAFVIDNDATRSTFGTWFRRGYPQIDPDAVERFWSQHGWTRIPVDMGWSFDSREDLEAVVRIEFTPEVADEVTAGHEGLEVDYAVNVWWRHF